MQSTQDGDTATMYRRAKYLRNPFAWALILGLSFTLVGCGGSSAPPPADSSTKPAANPPPKKLTKSELKQKFLEDEPTAAQKRSARLKAAK
jgi:hypothetical protein